MRTLFPFISKVVTSFLAVVTNYFVAKHLGIAYFGVYSSILSLSFVINLFADWGINLYGSQYLANAADKNKFIATANTFKFLLGIGATIFFFAIALTQSNGLLFYVVSLPLVFCNFLNPEWVSKGVLEPHVAALRQLLFGILNFIFVLIAVYFGLPVISIIIIYVFNTVLSFLVIGYKYKNLSFFRINFKLPIKDFFKNTKWYFAGFLLNNLVYSLGIIFLNSFSLNNEASIYSSYYNIFTNVAAPVTIVFGLIAPIYNKQKFKVIKDYYNATLLLISLGLIFYAFNSWVFNMLYPKSFKYDEGLNKLSAAYFVFFCLEQMFVSTLMLDEKKKKYLIVNVIGALVFSFLWTVLLLSKVTVEAKHAMLILIASQVIMILFSIEVKNLYAVISINTIIVLFASLLVFFVKPFVSIYLLFIFF